MDKQKVGAGVGVLMLRKGKILLGKRNTDYDKADSKLDGASTWTMPGGSLEFGESFEIAAQREVLEETGIKLDNAKVICVNNDKTDKAHFITIGLFSEDFEGEAKVMEEAITEWQWFDLDKLPENIFMPSKKVIENYKQKQFYLRQ